MSTVVHPKGHRHTRSAATVPPATASSQDPQNPHHLNLQIRAQNPQLDMNHSVHPSTPPRTPRRDNNSCQHSSQSRTNPTAPETGSKQKPRNKRSKNVMTSPAMARNDHNTPPLTGAQSAGMPSSAKPISTPSAYAGPTFHASPAPSALPIPSFYSKSVPESPGVKGLKSLKELSLPESPTPPPAPASYHQSHREESPLDFFFKADREEKARARSANSTQTAVAVTGPYQPPPESPSANQNPSAPASRNRPRHANRISSSGMFAMELDGPASPGTPYGSAFSTPYSERIKAARSSHAPPLSNEKSTRDAKQTATSEALKAYLFSDQQLLSPVRPSATPSGTNGLVSSNTSSTSTEHRSSSLPFSGPRGVAASPRPQINNYPFTQDLKTSTHGPRSSGRSSGLRQEVTPTSTPTKTPDRHLNYGTSPTPSRMYGHSSDTSDFIGTFTRNATSPIPVSSYGVSSGTRSADLKGMEDSLRKILKLESAGSSGASVPGIGSVPVAAVSVSDYVGGGAPPMNSLHNGVMGA
jgi:hypothetical protein